MEKENKQMVVTISIIATFLFLTQFAVFRLIEKILL